MFVNIKITEEYYYIIDIEDARKFLIENKENDILICCHCDTLYDSSHADWGHMVLFDSINNNKVILLNLYFKRNYEAIPLERLIKSIAVHGINNRASFYSIK